TTTGTIGCIGGTELPPVKVSFAAFEAGARRVRPDVKVVVSYLGNWDDVGAGKEQALAQIGRGVDVIFQNADAAGLGVFQAARETRKAFVIGSNANQNGVAPEVVLGSVVIDIPHALMLVAREVKAGTFTPRVVPLGLKSDVVTLVLNDALRARIPAAVLAGVDSVKGELLAGRIVVPRGTTPPVTP
ncbi:MAG: BMP family protein, partial [Gemmatimonadota bacterium]